MLYWFLSPNNIITSKITLGKRTSLVDIEINIHESIEGKLPFWSLKDSFFFLIWSLIFIFNFIPEKSLSS